MAEKKRIILNSSAVEQTIKNLAREINQTYPHIKDVVLIGIQTRGVPLARRISQNLYEKKGHKVPVGVIDITLYRDDMHAIALQPLIKETDIPFDLNDRIVILVDDVIFTGRSIRAAIDQLVDFGRPQAVRLCVLLDRGHRELPIQPDFVGKTVATARNEQVNVLMKEVDGLDQIVVSSKKRMKKARAAR